jgi:mono/diheme cytochrome c family protein
MGRPGSRPAGLSRSLIALAVALVIALLALSPANALFAAQGQPPATTEPDAEGAEPFPAGRSGESVYADACSSCHGRSGMGRIGPALAGNRNLERADYVLALILRGGDGMPAFAGRITQGEIFEVAGHIRSSWGNDFGGLPAGQLAAQWWRGAEDSGELFRSVCARCHGAEGGGRIGPALALNDNLTDPQYVAGKILHGQGGMPAFETLLDAETIAALGTYIRTSFGNDFGPLELGTVLELQTVPASRVGGALQATASSRAGTPGELVVPVGGVGGRPLPNEQEYMRACAPCHGPAGQGGVGPPLAGNANAESAEFVIERVLRGAGRMPAFGHRLSSARIAAIVTHERTAWGNGFGQVTPERVEALRQAQDRQGVPDEELASGADLYADNCAVCHGSLGGGSVAAPALAGNPALGDDRHVLSRIVMGGEGMPPFGQALSSAEIAALASHVRTAWGNDFGAVDLGRAQDYHGGASGVPPP